MRRRTGLEDDVDVLPEAEDRAPELLAKCKDVVSHPWARMIAEKAESGTQADNFVHGQLGWPYEVSRQVRALTYLRRRFPEFYEQYEDNSKAPGLRLFTFQDKPVSLLTTVVRVWKQDTRKVKNEFELILPAGVERIPVFAEKSFSFGPLEVESTLPVLLGELAAGKPDFNTYDTDPEPLPILDTSEAGRNRAIARAMFEGRVRERPTYKRYLKYKGIYEDGFYPIMDATASWAHTVRDLEDKSLGWDLQFINAQAHMLPEPDKYGQFEIQVATRIHDPYDGFPPKVFKKAVLLQIVDFAGRKVCNRVRLLVRRDTGERFEGPIGQMTYERFLILDEVNDVTVAILKTSYDISREYMATLVMKDPERHPRVGIQDFPYLDEHFRGLQRHSVHNHMKAEEGIALLTPVLALFQDMDYQFHQVKLEDLFGLQFLQKPPKDVVHIFIPPQKKEK